MYTYKCMYICKHTNVGKATNVCMYVYKHDNVLLCIHPQKVTCINICRHIQEYLHVHR